MGVPVAVRVADVAWDCLGPTDEGPPEELLRENLTLAWWSERSTVDEVEEGRVATDPLVVSTERCGLHHGAERVQRIEETSMSAISARASWWEGSRSAASEVRWAVASMRRKEVWTTTCTRRRYHGEEIQLWGGATMMGRRYSYGEESPL